MNNGTTSINELRKRQMLKRQSVSHIPDRIMREKINKRQQISSESPPTIAKQINKNLDNDSSVQTFKINKSSRKKTKKNKDKKFKKIMKELLILFVVYLIISLNITKKGLSHYVSYVYSDNSVSFFKDLVSNILCGLLFVVVIVSVRYFFL